MLKEMNVVTLRYAFHVAMVLVDFDFRDAISQLGEAQQVGLLASLASTSYRDALKADIIDLAVDSNSGRELVSKALRVVVDSAWVDQLPVFVSAIEKGGSIDVYGETVLSLVKTLSKRAMLTDDLVLSLDVVTEAALAGVVTGYRYDLLTAFRKALGSRFSLSGHMRIVRDAQQNVSTRVSALRFAMAEARDSGDCAFVFRALSACFKQKTGMGTVQVLSENAVEICNFMARLVELDGELAGPARQFLVLGQEVEILREPASEVLDALTKKEAASYFAEEFLGRPKRTWFSW